MCNKFKLITNIIRPILRAEIVGTSLRAEKKNAHKFTSEFPNPELQKTHSGSAHPLLIRILISRTNQATHSFIHKYMDLN